MEMLPHNGTEQAIHWQLGFKKYGNTIVRFCTPESVDPGVLIEKYADTNKWFVDLVGEFSPERQGLDLGISCMEDTSYEPKPEDIAALEYYQRNNLCSTLETVAVIEHSPQSLRTTNEDSVVPQDEQLKLFV